jgi:hypothetical protein
MNLTLFAVSVVVVLLIQCQRTLIYQSNGCLPEFLGDERRSTLSGPTAVLGIQTSIEIKKR